MADSKQKSQQQKMTVGQTDHRWKIKEPAMQKRCSKTMIDGCCSMDFLISLRVWFTGQD